MCACQDAVDEYAARHPLPRFCRWFVSWARHVLRECRRCELQLTREERDGGVGATRCLGAEAAGGHSGGDVEGELYECAKQCMIRRAQRDEITRISDCDVYEAVVHGAEQPSVPRPVRRASGQALVEQYHKGGEWVMGGRAEEGEGGALDKEGEPFLLDNATVHDTDEGGGGGSNCVVAPKRESPCLRSGNTPPRPEKLRRVFACNEEERGVEESLRISCERECRDVGASPCAAADDSSYVRKSASDNDSNARTASSSDSSQSDDGRVGALWSAELHKEIWRFFTPSELL